MKRAFVILACLFAMLSAGTSLRAQEIVISLHPGWNRIGYPFPEPVSLDSVFDPVNEDIIESENGVSVFDEDQWWGEFYSLEPGSGYLYYSNRSETISLVLRAPSSSSVTVTTSEPTGITATNAVVGGNVTIGQGNHIYARGVCWGMEPNPTVDDSHTSNGINAGLFNLILTQLVPNTTYYVRAYVVTDGGLAYGEAKSFTMLDVSSGSEDGYVDLGLPSGNLWAICNVGANTPEEYGDYFAWGETETKNEFSWNSYQHSNGDGSNLTKYCFDANYGYNGFTDELTVLQPDDDAATVNMGADWRMPTEGEWFELIENTTGAWMTINGVDGVLLTASNGNTLFLPAAGNGWDGFSGISGYYWSSSLHWSYPDNALNFQIWHEYGGSVGGNVTNRYIGGTVRAIRSSAKIIHVTVLPNEGGEVSGEGNYQQGTECTLTATANAGYTFTNWTEDGEEVSTDATYSFIVTENRTLVANFTANVVGDHAYVDLGLPSGTLWATCNVGADNPEDYGDYFAWGETQPKETYDWSTYQYCNGDYNTLTKYCNDADYGYNGFTDNLTTLLPEDDAATANWGSAWRMPTATEWEELYNNTTCTWTTQNGVDGMLFTASNGNSLFLPAAGWRYYSSLNDAGIYSSYWSSTLETDYDGPFYAWEFDFGSDYYTMGYSERSGGLPVRSVRSDHVQSYTISVSVNPNDGGSVSGDGTYEWSQSCTLTATPNEGYVFTNWTENGEVVSAEVSYSFTVTNDRNIVANFNPSIGGHGYVDLGLPSGTLWATCNVGSNAPEEYGDYFAWGETQPKDEYNWNTYQYCNGSSNTLTKYCSNSSWGYNGFTDNLTELVPEDDAATANWGNEWRMPTEEEWRELYNNTTVTWTTQNGVNGRLFTASNGNSLFLPAAGCRLDVSLGDAGSYGYYWSSTLKSDSPDYAWRFYFNSYYHDVDYDGLYRNSGQSVRAVHSAQN